MRKTDENSQIQKNMIIRTIILTALTFLLIFQYHCYSKDFHEITNHEKRPIAILEIANMTVVVALIWAIALL